MQLKKRQGFIAASLGVIFFGLSGCSDHVDDPPIPTEPSTCVVKEQGGSTSCKPVDVWKSYASEDCKQLGLELSKYAPREDCGDGGYRYVQYGCCPPQPPPPPPVQTCTTKSQGSPTSCKPVDVWKSYASDDCTAAGLQLRQYSPNVDCGDGNYRYVKYECCK